MLGGLPDANLPGTANNYTTLQNFTADSNKAGGKIDVQLTPSLSMFGRYGWRDLNTFDQPNIPLPSGGAGNGSIYAQQQTVRARLDLGRRASSLLEVAVRLLVDAGGEESAGARLRRARSISSGSPGCRPTRALPAACRRS